MPPDADINPMLSAVARPEPPRCRRCGYDLTGLPAPASNDGVGSKEAISACPECGLAGRLNSGPLIWTLGPRALTRLVIGCRALGFSADLLSAVSFMLGTMTAVASSKWLDPLSVPALNYALLGGLAGAWLVAAPGSWLLVVRDPVFERRHGMGLAFWSGVLPITLALFFDPPWPLEPLLLALPLASLVCLPVVTVLHIRRLGRMCSTGDLPVWADSASIFGTLCIFGTYLLGVIGPIFASRRDDDSLGLVVALLAGVAFQVFAWSFRLAARDISKVCAELTRTA